MIPIIVGALAGLVLFLALCVAIFVVVARSGRSGGPPRHQSLEVPSPPVRDCYCYKGMARGRHGLARCTLVGAGGRLDHYTAHPDTVRDLPELFPTLETWIVGACNCGQPAAAILQLQDHRARLVCGNPECLDGAATLTSRQAGT